MIDAVGMKMAIIPAYKVALPNTNITVSNTLIISTAK
jgi:hypothetical protein